MPYKSREARRTHDRDYKRLVWRPRQNTRAAEARRLATQRQEWLEARRLDNLVPLILTEPLHIDGHTFQPGAVVRVQPGVVHRWQRALLADPVPQMEPIRSVRIINVFRDLTE